MTAKTYLKIFTLSFILGAISLASFNYVIDPLFLFNSENITKDAAGYDRQYKPWHIREKHPELVVIGNSRTDFSFDVATLGKKPAYNLSLQGAGMSDMLVMMKHVIYTTNAKEVYVVIESVCSTPSYSSSNVKQFAEDDLTNFWANVERIKYLFDIDNLRKGLSHIMTSSDVYYDNNGKRLAWITDNETINTRTLKRESRTILNGSTVDISLCKTDDFEQLLRIAHQHNIALSILINPVNVRYLEIINQFDNLDFYLQFNKEMMVNLVKKTAAEYNQSTFPIYDFLLINRITTEPFNLTKDIEPKYWWESSHYKDNVGNLMTKWIISPKTERDPTLARQLTPANVTSHNLQQQALFEQWRANTQSTIEEIGTLVSKLK